MKKRTQALILALAIVVSVVCAVASHAAAGETVIVLSDDGITVDGAPASTQDTSAVYTGAAIVYYEDGHDETYGEGTSADAHTADEAAAHTVVTITQPGTYRLSGTLSAGQIAVDLGADASDDPEAVVTLILDGLDITCTVAPAVIFYNVYECGVVDTTKATPDVDTSKAGANVILADGSVNQVDGAYVARIYQPGTTKKLHKYDGAFYSRMSMNVGGETQGTGVLNITAANEGLDSELHLTINGGIINIVAQNDGINTNEDGVSVTTINGGTLTIDGGFGVEGDGVDSNGYLVINGGTLYSTAHTTAGDGGIDADMDILIHGGTVVASGTRNDAVGLDSKQAFIELSFAATQKADTVIQITDGLGEELFSYAPARNFQSLTVSLPTLALNTTYHVYAGGVQQQYTGTGSGFRPGGGMGGMGGQPPEGWGERPVRPDGEWPEDMTFPEGMTPPEGMTFPEGTTPPEGTFDGTVPDGQRPGGGMGGMGGQQAAAPGEGTPDFVLTDTARSFTGVSDYVDATGKTAVVFSINGGTGIESVPTGDTPRLSDIRAVTKSGGETVTLPDTDVQVTVTDIPSEDYAETCLLADGEEALADILPTGDGTYQLTITVLGDNEHYVGTTQWLFKVGGLPFVDVAENSRYFEAIAFVYEEGLMVGTGDNNFSPNQTVSRAMAVTVLGRLADAATAENTAFTDVVPGSWYAPYLGWASDNGIVTGYGNGQFGPEDAVTRQQMCVILANYAASRDIALTPGTLSYTDADSIAEWARDAVTLCAGAGLLDALAPEGTPLNPDAPLNRGELAQLMMALAAL